MPIQCIHSDNVLMSQHMGTKNSNISKCNSIASLKFLNVCTVFVNTETGMVCLCSAQCSLNVFNSACLMWHCECRTLTSIYVTLPTLFKKMHKTCAWRTMSFNVRFFFIYFFAIEILQLSSICSRIFCRLFDFFFSRYSASGLFILLLFVVAERSHRKVRLSNNNEKKPAKLTNKQIGYKSYRASQMTIEQCVQRITANRTN